MSQNRATPERPAPPPWTPGPRRVRFESYGAKVIAEDGTPLGWHGRNGGMSLAQAHANAILDAAGPELVSALEGATEWMIEKQEDEHGPRENWPARERIERQEAVLAKARARE